VKRWLAAGFGVALASCGGPSPSPAASPALAPRLLPATVPPDVDLVARDTAVVRGQRVAFDGLPEGLAWPALDRALSPRALGATVTLQASRDVAVVDVLRAAWTARSAVRLQTPDASGVLRVAELHPKDPRPAGASGCHLAVFLRPDGTLRVAAPGGALELGGDHPAESLARSIEVGRAACPIRYVAFGADSDAAAWGPVFDLIVAVDRDRSAGDARYVLGQSMARPK